MMTKIKSKKIHTSMPINYYTFIAFFIIISLVIAVPKTDSLFFGIFIAYIGFAFLNIFPFKLKFNLPKMVINLLLIAAVFCIGYGWGVIINMSHGIAPGTAIFFGAFLILVSFSGLILTLIDWSLSIERDGPVSSSVFLKGTYALVRHPQVLFSILFLIGLDLYFWSVGLTWTIPLWIIGFVSYAALEEKMEMVPRFGEKYLDYCEKVPGIVPVGSSIASFFNQFKHK